MRLERIATRSGLAQRGGHGKRASATRHERSTARTTARVGPTRAPNCLKTNLSALSGWSRAEEEDPWPDARSREGNGRVEGEVE
jgi:hypothetical protein